MLHPQAELEGWIRDCVDHLRAADNYRVARAHQDEFYLLFGVIVRTIRYADAYLDLVHLNKEAEAVPLARAALEHAITLQWVFIVDGGVARFSRSVASERASHYAKLADWLENEELLLEVGKLEEPPAGKGLAPFTNLMRELDHDEFLETSYHILSQQVHVTHSAVVASLSPGDGEVHITYDQQYGYREQATYTVAAACMLARWVLGKLTNDENLLSYLDEVSDRLLLPMSLEDNLPARKRRPGLF